MEDNRQFVQRAFEVSTEFAEALTLHAANFYFQRGNERGPLRRDASINVSRLVIYIPPGKKNMAEVKVNEVFYASQDLTAWKPKQVVIPTIPDNCLPGDLGLQLSITTRFGPDGPNGDPDNDDWVSQHLYVRAKVYMVEDGIKIDPDRRGSRNMFLNFLREHRYFQN